MSGLGEVAQHTNAIVGFGKLNMWQSVKGAKRGRSHKHLIMILSWMSRSKGSNPSLIV